MLLFRNKQVNQIVSLHKLYFRKFPRGGPYPVALVQTLGSFFFVFYLGRPGPLNEGGGEPYSQHFLGQHVAGRVPAPVGGRLGWVYILFSRPPSPLPPPGLVCSVHRLPAKLQLK